MVVGVVAVAVAEAVVVVLFRSPRFVLDGHGGVVWTPPSPRQNEAFYFVGWLDDQPGNKSRNPPGRLGRPTPARPDPTRPDPDPIRPDSSMHLQLKRIFKVLCIRLIIHGRNINRFSECQIA